VGPFFWAGMVAFGMVMTAILAHFVGRWRGGKGELADAVILIAWLQFIQLLLVVVQLILLVALPVAAPIVEIGSLFIFLWLLVNFVAEMHGFRSLGLVFLGVIITFVVAVFRDEPAAGIAGDGLQCMTSNRCVRISRSCRGR
jgi:hypothetical protein